MEERTEFTGQQPGERTFTQEEVNRIVQERLARVKADPSGREAELDRREKELTRRELRYKAEERFREGKLPVELLNVLDYSDAVKLDRDISIIAATLAAQSGKEMPGVNYRPAAGGNPTAFPDPVREAMGL